MLQNKVGNKYVRQTIGEIVTFHTIIQGNKSIGKNNQINFHETKDTAVNNHISIILSYTFNEKVKPFYNLFATEHTQNVNMLFKDFPYLIDKQNVIPVCISPNGLNYIHKKDITLKELMRIKDVCRNHPSDHFMLTPRTIKHLGINING